MSPRHMKALDKPAELSDEALDWVAGGSKPASPGLGTFSAYSAGSELVTFIGLGKQTNDHGPN
jgi:hypothetical protein